MHPGFLVSLKVRTGLEALGAESTVVWPLSRVGVQMLSQMGRLLESFPTHSAGISSVPAMNTEYVRLHIRVSREKLQTNPASKFVLREVARLKIRIFMMLLELMGLHHHLAFDASVTSFAVVRDVQIIIIGDAG